jgi:hypothetical protein
MQKTFDKTVSQVIADKIPAEIVQLRDYGIIVEGDSIYVSNNHAMLKKHIFRGTRWENCWAVTLARLPGAERGHVKRFGAHMSRCVKIPKSVMEKVL